MKLPGNFHLHSGRWGSEPERSATQGNPASSAASPAAGAMAPSAARSANEATIRRNRLFTLTKKTPVTAQQADSVPTYRHVSSLPAAQREAFQNAFDPVRRFALNDDTPTYRAIERKWIQDSTVAGNPNSIASCENHLLFTDNPHYLESLRISQDATESESVKQYYRELINSGMPPYVPPIVSADTLPQPTLNVIIGKDAELHAAGYLDKPNDDRAVVRMKLGDLRKAGGGDVFFDRSSALGHSVYLVTLPAGQRVAVDVVDANAVPRRTD